MNAQLVLDGSYKLLVLPLPLSVFLSILPQTVLHQLFGNDEGTGLNPWVQNWRAELASVLKARDSGDGKNKRGSVIPRPPPARPQHVVKLEVDLPSETPAEHLFTCSQYLFYLIQRLLVKALHFIHG